MENLSEKFAVIIEKFLIWTDENDYSLFSKDCNSKVEWDTGLLSDFKEPGRNKLETFVKKLSKEYVLTKDNEAILDIKMMVNNFKQYKPKIVKEKKKRVQKEKSDKKESIYIDFDVNTNESYNIDTLEYFTNELIKVFGKPKEIKDTDSKYEWKLKVNDNTYSIYDWIENGENFDEATWYLAGFDENKKDIDELYKYIDTKLNTEPVKCEITNEETATEEITNEETANEETANEETTNEETANEETAKELDELFGNSDNEGEETEINLDMISETLELDIDNLEF